MNEFVGDQKSVPGHVYLWEGTVKFEREEGSEWRGRTKKVL